MKLTKLKVHDCQAGVTRRPKVTWYRPAPDETEVRQVIVHRKRKKERKKEIERI